MEIVCSSETSVNFNRTLLTSNPKRPYSLAYINSPLSCLRSLNFGTVYFLTLRYRTYISTYIYIYHYRAYNRDISVPDFGLDSRYSIPVNEDYRASGISYVGY
jgi:hypothetical protein